MPLLPEMRRGNQGNMSVVLVGRGDGDQLTTDHAYCCKNDIAGASVRGCGFSIRIINVGASGSHNSAGRREQLENVRDVAQRGNDAVFAFLRYEMDTDDVAK